MEEYREDREQYYLAMMKEISEHKDFGRKNPVDIGTECGYTEEDVLDMIHMLQQKKEKGEIYTGTSSDKTGYFLVWKEQKAYIVAVEMQDWKAEVIKELKAFERKDKFDIKDHIFVRTAGNEKKTVLWENLDTGEKKRLLTDESIRNLIILDYGILILMETEMLVWDGDKILTEKKYTDSMLRISEVIQAGDSIYFYYAKNSYIYTVDKLLKSEISKYYVMTDVITGSSEKRKIQEIGNDRRSAGKSHRDKFSILLGKLVPMSLAEGFLRSSSGTDVGNLAHRLKNWEFRIPGYVGYERCVVTAGGVATDGISPRTMESRTIPGLFMAGEILDLDCDTGGYNLQTAFSTGMLAGMSAAK